MWIEELPNGNFKYREKYKDPLTGKEKTVSRTLNKHTRKLEQMMLLELQEIIEEKIEGTNKEVSFKELCDQWLKVFKKQVKASTYYNNVTYMKTFHKTTGDILLTKLTAAHINSAILILFEKDYKYDTVRGMVAGIRNALRFGKTYGYLLDNTILDGIEIPKINLSDKNKNAKYKFLERNELSKVIATLRKKGHDEVARMALIQTYTGIRHGELISIDYDKHINWKERTIRIERTWYHRKKMFQTPKTGDERTINFNIETGKLLKEQIQFSRLKVMANNLDRDNRLLFTNLKNEPFTNSYTNELLNRFINDTNLIDKKHVTTHIFRHTCIAFMVEQGTSKELIAKHCGHVDTQMIDTFYSHFTKKMEEDLKDAVNSLTL